MMSIDVFGIGRQGRGTGPDPARLTAAVGTLRELVAVAGDRIPPDVAGQASAVADRVEQRTSLSELHTVVALAGVTGGGKSSLFNALVGDAVAETGVRRPITSTTQAAVWGEDTVPELLDWLGVSRRHRVEALGDDPLAGLVLLDLPDFDSRVAAHRVEADRILERADLFVWITDPQKYADAVMHEQYLAPRAATTRTMVVVLNHADTLADDDARLVADDLRRLLEVDGVRDPHVVLTSAVTGRGIDALRALMAEVVERRQAALARLWGDVQQVAAALQATVSDADPHPDDPHIERLVDALMRAAGVPVVLDVVRDDHRRQAAARTGWVFTRWARRFRRDPLRRLRLNRERPGKPADELDREIEGLLRRTSLPPPTPAASADVELASQRVSEAAGAGLPPRWRDAVHDTAVPSADGLRDALDQAIAAQPLGFRQPVWWRIVSGLQWLLGAIVMAGVAWYLVLALLDVLRFETSDVPRMGAVPYPFLMIVAGAGLGLGLAGASRLLARFGAERRRRRTERRLRIAVQEVAMANLIEPVVAVLGDHAKVRDLIRSLSDEAPGRD